jgi:hypothetical protein
VTLSFPVVICLVGSVPFFVSGVKLRHFKVPEKPPASRAGLTIEQRQQKIQFASWLSFALSGFMLFGAILLSWLG